MSSSYRIPTINDKPHILILDDEAAVVRSLQRQLIDVGFHIHTATNPEEAEELCRRVHMDVAVVDQHLGSSLNGLEFLTRLQTDNSYCFRIIFTGDADFDFALQAINQGHVDAFLPKPWNEDQLQIIIRQGAQTAWLRQHNALLHEDIARRNLQLENFNLQLEDLVQHRTRELEQANAELTKYQQEVIHLETQASISQLVGGLAHELSNPLAVILGYAQRYIERPAPVERLMKCISVIEKEASRCQEIIDRMRRFVSTEKETPQPCMLNNILQSAQRRITDSGKSCPDIEVDDNDTRLLIGKRSLTQTFEHIIENAKDAKATKISVHTERAHDRLFVHLDNDGSSPQDEEIRNAIKPFYTSKGVSHTGLGLSLASSLLGGHGCTITLTALENGARCSIVFPLEQNITNEAHHQLTPAPSENILIVDDEDMIADLLIEASSELGFNTTHVSSVQESLKAISQTHFDAALVDANLPDGHGISVLEALKDHMNIQGRVAFISGNPDDPQLQEATQTFKCPVISKPFRMRDVRGILHHWLNQNSAHRPNE